MESYFSAISLSTEHEALEQTGRSVGKGLLGHCYLSDLQGCIHKLPDWLPGARTANGTTLCH